MQSKSKNLLVIGGAGYIGTHVVEQALKQGYFVTIFDQFIFGKNPIKDLLINPSLKVIEGNIGNLSALILAIKDADYVVHLAGLVGDPACAVNQELTIQTNVVSTKMIKEISKAFRIKRFVFASSCSVYGSNEDIVDESSPLNPVSLYAKTKIDSETEIQSDKSLDFHPVILRFATVFGHSRRPRFDLVANLFTAQAWTLNQITVSGSNSWRPFVHVSDLARAILLAIDAPAAVVEHQIFNVGDDSLNITIGNLAKLIKIETELIRNKPRIQIITSDKNLDQRNYHVSFKKIANSLGFAAKVNFNQGVHEILEQFVSNKYEGDYKDDIYSNLEMTKLINENYQK